MSNRRQQITAVVLAAGQSRRMGVPKLLLPWNDGTVLGHCLAELQQSKVDGIVAVSGYEAEAVTAIAQAKGVPVVHNPDYERGEMLSSLQRAIRDLGESVDAVLVVLADQPMIGAETINQILEAYQDSHSELLAPAYQGQRGNPVVIGRRYFAELLALPPGDAPRSLLQRHEEQLELLEVETAAVLQDLDRPEDYKKYHPK